MYDDDQSGSRRWSPTRIALWVLIGAVLVVSEALSWTGHGAASWAVDGVALVGVSGYLLVRRTSARGTTAIDQA